MAPSKRQEKHHRSRTGWLPLALTLVLALFSLAPRVQESADLFRSFWAAAAVLLLWQAILFWRLRKTGARRTLKVELRRQHYLQAAIQVAVFAYWGYYFCLLYTSDAADEN